MTIFLSESARETRNLGEYLAKSAKKLKGQIILALLGPLGSGKTTFLKGFAKGLGIKKRIISPSFLIFREFKLKDKRRFYHFDCWRIKSVKELKTIGFKEILEEENSIIAIEWAEKILKHLPKNNLLIFKFKYLDKNKREIRID